MRRSWIVLGMLVVGIAGLGALVWQLVATSSADLAASSRDPPALAAPDTARASDPERDPAPSLAAERRDLGDPMLAPPDREELRRLEQQGRALFWGLVLDPRGAPCAGATIFHGGKEAATSDASGAWKIEIEHDVAVAFDGATRPLLLVARKEGVGIGAVDLVGRSRKIDLSLEPGAKLRGGCVERLSKRPVPRATITLRFWPDRQRDPVVGFDVEAEADERGEFAVDSLLPGGFLARAVAEEWESGGFDSFAFDAGRERPYELPMDPRLTVRGWFTPWPPPAASGSKARVVASPDHSNRSDDREFGGVVGEDGRFRFRLPSTRRVELVLDAGVKDLWGTRLDLEEAPHDLDLGRIDLETISTERVRVRGRFVAPPELLELGLVARAHCWGGLYPASEDFEIAPDGRFEVALPLPNETLNIARIRFARRPVDGWFDGSQEIALTDAKEVELPPIAITPRRLLVVGAVTDDAGVPIEGASVALPKVDPRTRDLAEAVRIHFQSTWEMTDVQGRFLCVSEAASHADSQAIVVKARGYAAQTFTVEGSLEPGCLHRDLRLARSSALHGRLVDESGAALGGWRIGLLEEGGAQLAWDVSDSDGSFTMYGVAPQRCRAQVSPNLDVRSLELPAFDVTSAPVLLRVDRAASSGAAESSR